VTDNCRSESADCSMLWAWLWDQFVQRSNSNTHKSKRPLHSVKASRKACYGWWMWSRAVRDSTENEVVQGKELHSEGVSVIVGIRYRASVCW